MCSNNQQLLEVLMKIGAIAFVLAFAVPACGPQMDAPTADEPHLGSTTSDIINRDWGDPLGCYWDAEYGLCCAYSGGDRKWGCTWCTADPTACN
jgi:hypothetical protein